MSALTWQEYFLQDDFREELDGNALAIQEIIQHGEIPANNFRQLHDNKSLGFMTRSTWNDETQVTHSNTIRGSSLTKNVEYFGLMGGGLRAQAVRVEPNTLFKRSSTKKKLPTISDLLKIKTVEDVGALQVTTVFVEDFVQYYAVLPPFLLQETFNEENTSAANMLVKFTSIVKNRATEEVLSNSSDDSEGHPEDTDKDDDDSSKDPR